jgi:prephenate dehydrogenase
MRILVLGAGRMGGWMVDALCMDHELAVFDKNIKRMRYLFNTQRLVSMEEIKEFDPEMLINAVSLERTIDAFNEVLPFISDDCILADITSIKTPLREFYLNSGRRFVSVHPMFGPTFANVHDLREQNAIIIKQSDEEGKKFFRDFFNSLNLRVFEYTFIEHDETIAYSLSVPFASSIVFGSCMKKQEAPGTTFKKHMNIAKGLMSEDNYLLSEILFGPYSEVQLKNIHAKLSHLIEMIEKRDSKELHKFLDEIRNNIE